MNERIALFGGSFDPPHIGHLYIGQEVLESLGYDAVVYVPNNSPPHKAPSGRISIEDRVELLRRATSGNPGFRVDLSEIERGGVSYTIDTVRRFRELYGADQAPGLIIGDDLVEGFSRWRDVELLRTMVRIIVARRGAVSTERIDALAGPHDSIDNALVGVSSSDIRERIRSGRSYRYLVHEDVYAYIREHRLYCD